MFNRIWSGLLLALGGLAAGACLASVPPMISYQGKLLDSLGQPVPDGPHSMQFYIYDQETAGTLLWQEPALGNPPKTVQVAGGLFSVLLGSTVPLQTDDFPGSTWLQTEVDGELLTPRVRIVSAGYAFRAADLDLPFSSSILNGSPGFSITNTGSGQAGRFSISNAGSSSPALEVTSNGTGPALKTSATGGGAAGQFVGKLTVTGTAEVTGFKMSTSSSAGRVLTSDTSGVGTWQAPSTLGHISYTNVKDYGAVGNGVADDTAAIRAAMAAAAARNRSEQYPGGSYYNANAVVFFPTGKYAVTDTITLSADVLGEGTPILYQTNSQKDTFSNSGTWRVTVSGMCFVGGKNHINLGTNNIDSARIIIEKCQFNRAGDCAVRMQQGSNSTQVTIKDCTFIHCNQAFVNWCDMAKISDSWISSLDTMANEAVIENHGSLLAENICGVPWPVAGNDQRWIDNYGGVTCRNFRFGGEGAGFTAVVNWSAYSYSYPVIPSTVVLESCDIYAAGNPSRHCAIYCEEIPNQIIVRDCRGIIDIPVLTVRPTIDLNTYFDNAEQWCSGCLHYLIDRGTAASGSLDLPEQMRPYQPGLIEGDARPTTGKWKVGQFIRNRNCNGALAAWGWQCVQTGKPGVWQNVNVSFN